MTTESQNFINSESSISFNGVKDNDEVTDIPSKLMNEESLHEEQNHNDVTVEKESGEKVKPEWEDLLGSGSLMKKLLTEGIPNTRPQRLERVIINYECRLEDGTLAYKHENFSMLLGDCEVVQGLDLGIGLMNVGEKCELKIQPRLAYGAKGLPQIVPPNATVHYTVELVASESEKDIEDLSVAERKEYGNKKRERGNWWYVRGENALAIQCYRRALDYLDEVEGGIKDPKPDGYQEVTDAALQSLLEDRLNVCNNMAAAQIKLGHYDAALNSLQTVLRCQPDNIKALYRKAKIHKEKNDITAALKCLQKAKEISPNDRDVQKEISNLNGILQKQKVTERELARRMFSGSKSSADDEAKKKRQSSRLYVWGTLCASVVVGLVGLAAYRLRYTQGF